MSTSRTLCNTEKTQNKLLIAAVISILSQQIRLIQLIRQEKTQNEKELCEVWATHYTRESIVKGRHRKAFNSQAWLGLAEFS